MEITKNQIIESFLQNKEFIFKAKISEGVYGWFGFENAVVAGNTLLCKFVDNAGFILNDNMEYESINYVLNECIVIDPSIVSDNNDSSKFFHLSIDEMDAFYTADHIVERSTIPTEKIKESEVAGPKVLMTIRFRSQCSAGDELLNVIDEYINFYSQAEVDCFHKALQAITPDNVLKNKDDICAALGLGDLYIPTMNRLKRVLTGRSNIEPVPVNPTNLVSFAFYVVEEEDVRRWLTVK